MISRGNEYKINIFTDSGLKFGIGHLIRCQEIKDELLRNNINVKFFDKTINYKYHLNHKCDLAFIDLPYDMTPHINFWHNKGSKVVTLEYFDNTAQPDLNISVLDFPEKIKNTNYQISGLDFIIIRSKIRRVQTTYHGGYGLVMMGGGLNELLKINKLINSNYQIKIIVGPYTNPTESVKSRKNFEVLKNPKNLPEIMSGCDWCITNGGITMLEMIYYKKLIFSYPKNANERILSEVMLESGLINSINSNKIKIHKNDYYLPKINYLFDGLGAQRIVEKIKSKLAVE
tara:strand:+ start:2327 stop:3187 length:861 start_codon:yes stop_codon:yes gene_type:complete